MFNVNAPAAPPKTTPTKTTLARNAGRLVALILVLPACGSVESGQTAPVIELEPVSVTAEQERPEPTSTLPSDDGDSIAPQASHDESAHFAGSIAASDVTISDDFFNHSAIQSTPGDHTIDWFMKQWALIAGDEDSFPLDGPVRNDTIFEEQGLIAWQVRTGDDATLVIATSVETQEVMQIVAMISIASYDSDRTQAIPLARALSIATGTDSDQLGWRLLAAAIDSGGLGSVGYVNYCVGRTETNGEPEVMLHISFGGTCGASPLAPPA